MRARVGCVTSDPLGPPRLVGASRIWSARRTSARAASFSFSVALIVSAAGRDAHADRAARPGLLIESARAMNDSEISRDGKKADDVNGGA